MLHDIVNNAHVSNEIALFDAGALCGVKGLKCKSLIAHTNARIFDFAGETIPPNYARPLPFQSIRILYAKHDSLKMSVLGWQWPMHKIIVIKYETKCV